MGAANALLSRATFFFTGMLIACVSLLARDEGTWGEVALTVAVIAGGILGARVSVFSESKRTIWSRGATYGVVLGLLLGIAAGLLANAPFAHLFGYVLGSAAIKGIGAGFIAIALRPLAPIPINSPAAFVPEVRE